jgi:hypothetical protein
MTESSLLFGNASVTAIENVKMIHTDNEELIKACGFYVFNERRIDTVDI